MKNSHKFYEMTREEMWIDHMKKAKQAWKLGKEKWFLNHDPSDLRWQDACLG